MATGGVAGFSDMHILIMKNHLFDLKMIWRKWSKECGGGEGDAAVLAQVKIIIRRNGQVQACHD